jgi:hypothetical protein
MILIYFEGYLFPVISYLGGEMISSTVEVEFSGFVCYNEVIVSLFSIFGVGLVYFISTKV